MTPEDPPVLFYIVAVILAIAALCVVAGGIAAVWTFLHK